jgi:transketolase
MVCGPIAGTLLASLRDRPHAVRPRLWVVSELPIASLPTEFLDDLRHAGRLVVVEEHVAHGGVGQAIALALAKAGVTPPRVDHRHALGYPSGRYGSQKWHRVECGLDAASLLALFDDPVSAPAPDPTHQDGVDVGAEVSQSR